MNGAEFLWGCRGLAPAVFKTRNGLSPFRSEAADGGFPENARHFPVVKMPRPVGGEIHFLTSPPFIDGAGLLLNEILNRKRGKRSFP